MSASIASLTAILKEFYLGPIAEQLNQEILVYELFDKASVDWSGRRVVIPVHVARNTGVAFVADDGTLPTAGQQDFERLEIDAKFLYGRFAITGPAIASAKSGPNAFISYVDAEMNKLVEDVKTAANQRAIFGGRVLGYIMDTIAANVNHAYSGRQASAGLQLGNATDLVDVVRLDTYATVAANQQVNAITETQITFNGAVATNGGGAVFAVVATTASTIVGGVAGGWNLEPAGITTNLASPVHFGVDRTTATGAAALQSTHNSLGNGYQALTLDAIQGVLDAILEDSSEAPDLILMSPLMRQEYTALLVGTNAANLYVQTDSAKSGDGGFTGLAYGGIPMRTSKDCFKGSFFFLAPKHWKLTELEAPGFADLDGAILSRVPNQDKFEGFYRLYYNTVCTRPNANGVLTGIAF